MPGAALDDKTRGWLQRAGWEVHISSTTGCDFYYHPEKGVSQYELPPIPGEELETATAPLRVDVPPKPTVRSVSLPAGVLV